MMLASCAQVWADGGVVRFFKKLGATIDSMSVRGLDPRYISSPEKPWQIILKSNINQSDLKMKATFDGKEKFSEDFGEIHWEPRIKSDISASVGLWAGYRGYGLGYSKNVRGKGGVFRLGATGGSYGANLRINTFQTDEPTVRLSGYMPTWTDAVLDYYLLSPIKVRLFTIDAYYLFNGKRFSYAAAYDQSVIQKRSSGSLMVGGMYDHSTVSYEKGLNGDFILYMNDIGKIKQYQASLGGGYAYNLVPCKGLLISGMGMVTMTLYNRLDVWKYNSRIRMESIEEQKNPTPYEQDDGESNGGVMDLLAVWPLEDDPKDTQHSRMTPIIDTMFSVTYNVGNWFINANAQYNHFFFKHSKNEGSFTDWYVNASIGLRLR